MADAFDRFVDGTKQAFGAVADAATDLFERGKGYVNVRQIESRMRENYRALGELQYRAETGKKVDDAEKQRLVAALSDSFAELKKAANAGGAEKYEFVACAGCGAMIAKGSQFCSNCGKKVE